MKRTLLTILFLILPFAAFAQLKVGIMHPDDVLDALPETAQMEAELQQYIQERQQSFEARYQDWIDEITEFSERVERGELSNAEERREQERLTEKERELNNLQNRIQNQIQQRQNELFTPLLNRVEEAMATVSSELGIDFVINRQTTQGDPIVYYASERATDITDNVIEKLTQN